MATMMTARSFAMAMGFSVLLAPTSLLAGPVTFYDTQASFNANASTTLLDDYSTGIVTNTAMYSFTSHGVTYTTLNGTNVWDASPGYTNFGADVGTTTDYIITTAGNENIGVVFSSRSYDIGFNFYYNGLGPMTLTLMTTGGDFIFNSNPDGTDPATGLADKGYIGIVSAYQIVGFEWLATDGGILNTGIGDLSVGSPVPEPMSVALLGAALLSFAAFAALRRDRLKRA